MPPRTLERTRHELADFLRQKREQLSPEAVGLPSGSRRRTPGLRREEVAALAGVGLTVHRWNKAGKSMRRWHFWKTARVLQLDAAGRYHLFYWRISARRYRSAISGAVSRRWYGGCWTTCRCGRPTS